MSKAGRDHSGKSIAFSLLLFNEIYENYLHVLPFTAKISLDLVSAVMLSLFINKRDINSQNHRIIYIAKDL